MKRQGPDIKHVQPFNEFYVISTVMLNKGYENDISVTSKIENGVWEDLIISWSPDPWIADKE